MQRFDDDPLTVCTACGGSLRKVFSPVGIVFKGSGFYRTDSRKAAAKAEDSGAKAAKSGDSSGLGRGILRGKEGQKTRRTPRRPTARSPRRRRHPSPPPPSPAPR